MMRLINDQMLVMGQKPIVRLHIRKEHGMIGNHNICGAGIIPCPMVKAFLKPRTLTIQARVCITRNGVPELGPFIAKMQLFLIPMLRLT
ncbi:hypothetical protein D3C73_886360 [compost metagenome]